MSAVIDGAADKISNWLGGASGRLVVDGDAGQVVGRVLMRGASDAVQTSTARVVLQRDAGSSVGYRIVTAFPTP